MTNAQSQATDSATPVELPEATWVVELNVDCPKCGEHVDLLDAPDFWDGRQLDIAEHHTKRSDNMHVQCPECGAEFKVRCTW